MSSSELECFVIYGAMGLAMRAFTRGLGLLIGLVGCLVDGVAYDTTSSISGWNEDYFGLSRLHIGNVH